MGKEYLNTLTTIEIARRLHNGEKIFNETDPERFVEYVSGIGICQFRKSNGELLAMNLTLSLFSHLYFEKEDYKDMIGCVGWFWDTCEADKIIGILSGYKEKRENEPFLRNDTAYYCHFVPAKKSELKFWEEEE